MPRACHDNIDPNIVTDEYTALQKYISTYRDPNAAKQEDMDKDNEGGSGKKPWWKVGESLHLIAANRPVRH